MVVLSKRYLCLLVFFVCALAPGSWGSAAVMDAYFRPDVAFPQYGYFWNDSAKLGDKVDSGPLGGTVQIYVRNDGKSDIAISDVLLDRVSLSKSIAFSQQRKFRKHAYPASIHFSSISAGDKATLISAGEPVWWRTDPQSVKPGDCAELLIRLRNKPAHDVEVTLLTSDSGRLRRQVRVNETRPRMETIAFSPDRKTAYLYVTRKSSDPSPNAVLLDGKDITGSAKIRFDASSSALPIVCRLAESLPRGSFHCFQLRYPKGAGVTAATRVWDGDFAYGMWGAPPDKKRDTALAEDYFRDLALHNINTQMEQIGSEAVRSLMVTPEGVDLLKSLGIRRMVSDIGKDKSGKPWSYFLMDEPDAGDAGVKNLPGDSKAGALAQGIVERSQKMRQTDPLTPQLLNLDMTFKPQNWYTYGQIPDILTADPYYQVRLAEAYKRKPERVPVFAKADFVYAVSSVIASSQAPRPINCVLFTGTPGDEANPFRFATPEEKRIEAYYAVAAGAKGISYWWFHSLAKGLQGKGDPTAVAQWREMGVLGAELGTVGPLLMVGCPAPVPVTAPKDLWTRTILCGGDTLVLLCVNDNYTNDREGTRITPVESANVHVTLPSWLAAKDVFEINCRGTQDVEWSLSDSRAALALGKVNVTKMIAITADPALRARLQKLYEDKLAANVRKLLQ